MTSPELERVRQHIALLDGYLSEAVHDFGRADVWGKIDALSDGVVLDIALLVVATYRAAGAAAEIAAGRPPMPPLPVFATSGGVAAAVFAQIRD